MSNLTKDNIRVAILEYLAYELELEVKKAFKDKTPTQKSIDRRREKLEPNFEYKTWLNSLKNSLEFMQSHDLSFATHISKGIHSAVRSDNLLLNIVIQEKLSKYASSIDIPHPKLDANSNNTGSHAGHLKIIVNFLNIDVLGNRFYLLIKNKDLTIKDFFEQYLTNDLFDYLSNLLNIEVENPISDERNKQTLFPINDDNYHCIVPLFPSSLTHYVHQKINDIKYSELSKNARKMKFSKDQIGQSAIAYKDIVELAVVKLGGENAQNVSRLNNIQGGFHYLLPSLPPMIQQKDASNDRSFKISQSAHTLLNKSLERQIKPFIKQLFKALHSHKNTVDIRKARQEAIAQILNTIFTIAESIRNNEPAGWSKDSQLDEAQKFWLDPKRAQLDGEQEWRDKRESEDWYKQIVHDIARWINKSLQLEFKNSKKVFGDEEHQAWEKQTEDMQKQYERAGKGVFL